jgi:hypothetical protein
VWVEPTGTPDSRFDLKSVKAYTAVQKICIVGKRGKTGTQGERGGAELTRALPLSTVVRKAPGGPSLWRRY